MHVCFICLVESLYIILKPDIKIESVLSVHTFVQRPVRERWLKMWRVVGLIIRMMCAPFSGETKQCWQPLIMRTLCECEAFRLALSPCLSTSPLVWAQRESALASPNDCKMTPSFLPAACIWMHVFRAARSSVRSRFNCQSCMPMGSRYKDRTKRAKSIFGKNGSLQVQL